jgi:predicted Zn-dependent protease
MLEILDDAEVEFVVGHEIGHLALRHTQSLGLAPDSEYSLLKQQWRSRAAEISADRIGLMGCQSLTVAGKVMIKLASGLPWEHLAFDFEQFLAESADPSHHDEVAHLHRSHPALPIRLRALIEFARSRFYRKFTSGSDAGPEISIVDAKVRGILHSLGDRKLVAKEEERLDRTIAWCGAALILEDEVVTDAEESTLKGLVGEDLGTKVAAFARSSSRSEVLGKCEESIIDLLKMDSSYLQQVLVATAAFGDKLGLSVDETALGELLARVRR